MSRRKCIALFAVLWLVILGVLGVYYTDVHEKVHKAISDWYGYEVSPGIFHDANRVSTVTYIPASDLDSLKYWSWVTANLSFDGVSYQDASMLWFPSLLVAYVITRLICDYG